MVMVSLRNVLKPGILKRRKVSSFHFSILQLLGVFWGRLHKAMMAPLNGKPEEDSMPPNLETFISGECLPDVIEVYGNSTLFRLSPFQSFPGPLKLFLERYPVRFVRMYPPRTQTDKGAFNPAMMSPSDPRMWTNGD